MSQLVWRDAPPDSVGVWAKDLGERGGVAIFIVPEDDFFKRNPIPKARWCRIGDVPQIADPVKYRELTISDLANGPVDCEVQLYSGDWMRAKVVGYAYDSMPFYTDQCIWYKYARIAIDGKSRDPREWWVYRYTGIDVVCDLPCRDKVDCNEVIHVREVL